MEDHAQLDVDLKLLKLARIHIEASADQLPELISFLVRVLDENTGNQAVPDIEDVGFDALIFYQSQYGWDYKG